MRISRMLLIASAVVASLPAVAAAQPARKVGLTMSYPESVGLLWHLGDRVAVRPDFSFSFSSTELDDDGATSLDLSSENNTFTFGVSALMYVAQWDALRAYVTPRVGFITGHSESTVGISTAPFTTTREVDLSGYEVSGALGAEYGLGDRFALFGEVGFNYSSITSEVEGSVAGLSAVPDTKARGGGLRSGVGVVFYF